MCAPPPLKLLGLAGIGLGIFLTVINEDLDYVTGNQIYSGAVVLVTAGVAIAVVATFGIAAVCSDVWQLLTLVSKCRCL